MHPEQCYNFTNNYIKKYLEFYHGRKLNNKMWKKKLYEEKNLYENFILLNF